MRKIIMYCDRCKKEFKKWNHTEVYGIAEFVYGDSDPYLDYPKDLCESCYIELENWWNFTAQEESKEIEELKESNEDTEEEFWKAVEDIVQKGEDIV